MDKVGIELVLKENLADKLGRILPILERMDKTFAKMNKTLSMTESSQKRVDQQFKNIASSVDTLSRKERGLQSINSQMGAMSKATRGAKSQVDLLGRSLGGLKSAIGGIAGLVGIYKLIQGVGAVGGSAFDFEKQAKSLQQSNLTPDFQKKLIDQSLSLGSSGKYAMSASDFLSTFKEIRSVSKSPEAALGDLPLIGKVDMQMRQVDKKLEGQAALLPRFFEKFAAFDEKSKLNVADALLKGVQYTGGQVNPAQILQQISTSGTAVVGSDPYKEIVEQIYSIKESAAGASHGGGGSTGRGRGGVGRQALDRIVNLGIITPAMANMMKEAGMLEGITAAGGTSGHKTLIDGITGQHVLSKGGAGSGNLKTSDVHSFLLRSRPEWMRLHANDPEQLGLDFAAGADALSGNKLKGSFMQTRDAHLKHFASLPVDQQKSLEGQLMAGARMTGIDFIMERSVGRYLQSHNILAQGIKDQPGLGASGQLSVSDRWDKMMKAFETFGNVLGNNETVIRTANNAIDGLIAVIKALTASIDPIVKVLTMPDKIAQSVGGAIGGDLSALGQIGQALFPSPSSGRLGTKSKLGGLGMLSSPMAAIIAGEARKVGVDPMLMMAIAQQESGLNPGAIGDHGTSFGLFQLHKGGALGSMTPAQALDPTTNARNTANRLKAMKGHFGSPGELAAALQRPANPSEYAKSVNSIYQTINIHPMAGIDGEKIKKTVAEAVAPHLQRQQLKTARKMSLAASEAGGGFTDKTHNAGSGP